MFTKEDFLFKFDLKSGYHHLDIEFEPHKKYLSFTCYAITKFIVATS